MNYDPTLSLIIENRQQTRANRQYQNQAIKNLRGSIQTKYLLVSTETVLKVQFTIGSKNVE